MRSGPRRALLTLLVAWAALASRPAHALDNDDETTLYVLSITIPLASACHAGDMIRHVFLGHRPGLAGWHTVGFAVGGAAALEGTVLMGVSELADRGLARRFLLWAGLSVAIVGALDLIFSGAVHRLPELPSAEPTLDAAPSGPESAVSVPELPPPGAPQPETEPPPASEPAPSDAPQPETPPAPTNPQPRPPDVPAPAVPEGPA